MISDWIAEAFARVCEALAFRTQRDGAPPPAQPNGPYYCARAHSVTLSSQLMTSLGTRMRSRTPSNEAYFLPASAASSDVRVVVVVV